MNLLFLVAVTLLLMESSFAVDPTSEQCLISQSECEQYIADAKLTNKETICNNMGKYSDGMKDNCPVSMIRENMANYMKKTATDVCPNLNFEVCTQMQELENCVITYTNAMNIQKNTEGCDPIKALSKCLEKKAGCTVQSVKIVVDREIKNTDCYETLEICNNQKREKCVNDHLPPSTTCKNLVDFKNCLISSDCTSAYVHFALREIMTDKNLDCAEVNGCVLTKQEFCGRDLLSTTICTTENIYRECLKKAQCNDKHLEELVKNGTKFFKESCSGTDKCLEAQSECGTHIANVTLTDKETICSNLNKYSDCLAETCPIVTKRRLMAMYMMKTRTDGCPDINYQVCRNVKELEHCILTYKEVTGSDSFAVRQKAGDCELSSGLKRCIDKKAGCVVDTINKAVENVLQDSDCYEEVELCNSLKKEACGMDFLPPSTSCQNLVDFNDCLISNASCTLAHVRFALRKTMKDKNLDCADVNGCRLKAEENCNNELTRITPITCPILKTYEKCMSEAQCGQQRLKMKIDNTNNKYNHPCASCSLVASLKIVFFFVASLTCLSHWR